VIELLTALVRGDGRLVSFAATDPDALLALAEANGVASLAADRLAELPNVPEPLLSRFAVHARQMAAADLVREADLVALIAALETARIAPLIFKGATLAYTHYARPDLRARVDSDILVPAADRHRVDDVLKELDYVQVEQLDADLVMYQQPYEKRRAGGVSHIVDLHWRVANPQRFGAVLTYDELRADGAPVLALGPAAYGPSHVHALLLACVHRVAHHADSMVLIWQYDVYLIGTRLTSGEWDAFVTLAAGRGVSMVCRRSLVLAAGTFGARAPARVLSALGEHESDEENTAVYLSGERRHIQEIAWDIKALGSWRERWRLVRQHLLPSPAYMRGVYAPASDAPLAVLYVKRAWRGARKWMTKGVR
jgi:hypothetical protein